MPEEAHKFEVGIFNQEVVDQLAQGLRHKHLKDEWAENQYFQVTAASPDAAREKMMRRYPPENGYVIASIEPIKD